MVDFLSVLPFDIATIVISLVNAILAFAAIVLVDKIIAHEIDPKSALAMSMIAFFIIPIIGPILSTLVIMPPFIAGTFFTIVLPLIVWILLGEVVIKADQMTKIKVLVIAFAVYYVLSIFISPMIHGAILGFLPVF